MISHRHQCVFIHIPRCGGSSIESVLWPGERTESDLWMGFVDPGRNKYQTGGLQHLTAPFVRAEVGDETFDRYFKFAVVRNPYDRAVSQYAFHMQRRPDLRALLSLNEAADFKTYLRAVPHAEHVQWKPQHEFLFEGEHLLVDHLIRFETFDRDVAALFRRFGVDAEVPSLNGSQREPFESYYDDEARRLVGTIYARDLELFGYSFPD